MKASIIIPYVDLVPEEVEMGIWRSAETARVRHEVEILFEHDPDRTGPACTRNRALRKATGEIVLFTDADCLVPGDWAVSLCDWLEKHLEVDGVSGRLLPGKNTWVAAVERWKDRVLGICYNKETIGGREMNVGFTNNCAYRRSALLRVGGFDETFKLPCGEDVDLKNRICASGGKVAFIFVSVIHRQSYNWDYLRKRIYQQALNRKEGRFPTLSLLWLLPINFFNTMKKVTHYR